MNEEIWLRSGVRLGICKWVGEKNLPYAALVCLTPEVVERLVEAIMEKLRKPSRPSATASHQESTPAASSSEPPVTRATRPAKPDHD